MTIFRPLINAFEMSANPIRVLLVDDNAGTVEQVRELLEQSSMEFQIRRVPAADARAAFEADTADVCLLAGREGSDAEAAVLGLLKVAGEAGFPAPVIVLTAGIAGDLDMRAMSAGASDHLPLDELNVRLLERTIRYAMERYRTNAALRSSEERVRRILTSAPVLLFELDRQGIVTFVEGMALRVLGLRAEDLMGRSAFEIYPGLETETRQALAGKPFTVTVEIGGAVLESHVMPTRDMAGHVVGAVGVATDITRRVRNERALHDSRHLFKTFMDNSAASTFIKDSDLRYMFVNRQFAEQLGRPADEITGLTDHDLFRAEVAGGCEDTDRMVMRAGNSVTSIDEMADSRHFLTTKFVVKDAEGNTLVAGQSIDITERVRAEHSLRKSEERFQLAAKATNDAIWDWDIVTDTLWWNSNIRELFHYDADDINVTFDWWEQRIHPEDYTKVIESLRNSVSEGQRFWTCEYRFLCGDGTYAHVLDRGYLMLNGDGTPLRMIGAMANNTRQKEAEQALRASEERHRRIVETAQEGIMMMDATGAITFTNARMGRMLGYSPQLLLHRPLAALLHQEEQEAARNLLQARNDGEAFRGDMRLMRGDGSVLWARVSTSPLIQTDGAFGGTLAMVSDITARKEAERALREAHDQLEVRVAERTAEIVDMMARLEQAHSMQQRFVADVSHDLRTPLTVVRAELELLLDRGGYNDDTRLSLVRIAEESGRLENMANDLLLLATLDARQAIPLLDAVQLDDLLFDCVTALQTVARDKDIAWNIDVREPVVVRCNSSMLRRAFTNVLENAVKYSPASTLIDVSLVPEDAGAVIVISDHGPGIAEKDLARVFDRFYRGDDARNTTGTGLGLSIVKAVIEGHGGRITIESQPGRGTRVNMGLPLEPGETLISGTDRYVGRLL